MNEGLRGRTTPFATLGRATSRTWSAVSSDSATGWWARPCGGRDVLRLAIPLVVSTASWTVMNFIDRMFLLWYSTDAVAAAMPAGMVHFALVCFPLGVASYVNTFVAQYHGAGRPERIGPAVWQGARVGLFCIPLFLALIPLAPWIFRLPDTKPIWPRWKCSTSKRSLSGPGPKSWPRRCRRSSPAWAGIAW